MNCSGFEVLIVDLARDEARPAAEREAALAHAQVCGRCAGRLADERALTNGLRALVASTEEEQAPWTVEATLRRAFAQRPAAPAAPPRPVWRRWAPLGAAAAIVLLVISLGYRFSHSGGSEASREPLVASEAPFYPMLYGDDLSTLESGGVVRVRLPRGALASFGVTISEESRSDRIEADVLLGEDGLARAIRFVHVSEQ
jgi:hypothetical protein